MVMQVKRLKVWTDLTFRNNNLTATDVVVPIVGVVFGDAGEKIEGDGTDLTVSEK